MNLKVVQLLVLVVWSSSCSAQLQHFFNVQNKPFVDLFSDVQHVTGLKNNEKINDTALVNDSTAVLDKADRSGVEFQYQWRDIQGPYPVSQGNKTNDYGIKGYWQTVIDSSAQFIATASVHKGIEENIRFNVMRLGHLYGPYTLVNKRHADFKYQQYQLTAQYAANFKYVSWSIGADYIGDYAHTETDPRAKDISAWLGINTAARLKLPNHQLDLAVRYQHHTKNLDLDVWQGNVKYQFLLMRGFGMYDHDFMESVFNKKRLYRQNLFEIGLGGLLFKSRKTNVILDFNWAKSALITEEQNTINLHQLATSSLSTSFVLKRILAENWRASISTIILNLDQKGTENRYSLVKVNENYSGIYDYVKIGAVQPYSLQYNQFKTVMDLEYNPDGQQFGLFFAYGQTALEERYKGTAFYTQINKSQLELGGSYSKYYRNKEWGLAFRFQPERLRQAKNIKDTTVESMYDEVYLPQYLYNSRDQDTYSLAVSYAYSWFKKQKVGVRLRLSSIRGIHLNEVVYAGIQVTEFFGNTSVFWEF